MTRQILGVARHDLAVWLSSPVTIAAALLPALGMGLLVAVLTNSVGRQPVALVVQSEGRFAKRMARIIRADAEAYWLEEMPPAAAERALGEQRVAAMIVLPSDFDERVAAGAAAIDLYLNNVNIDIADDLRRSVTRSVAEFDAPQLSLMGELGTTSAGSVLPNPYRVAISEHNLRQTDVSFLQYQCIPILILIVINVGLLGTALMTARDFRRGTAKFMLLSPAGCPALVLGRLLGGTLLTLGTAAPLVFLLPVPSLTHGLALAALILAVTLTTVGLGILLGVAIRDERLVTMTALNASVCLFYLGGGFTTVAFLPGWIQTLSLFVPTRYAVEGLRQTLFYPDLVGFGRDMAVLWGCAIASVCLASGILARAFQRA